MVPKHKDKWAYRARSYLHTTSFYIYLTRKFFCALPKKQRPKISQITEIIDALSQEMMTVLAEESDRVKLPSGLGYLVVKKYRWGASAVKYLKVPSDTWLYRLAWKRQINHINKGLAYYTIITRPAFKKRFKELAHQRIVDYEI